MKTRAGLDKNKLSSSETRVRSCAMCRSAAGPETIPGPPATHKDRDDKFIDTLSIKAIVVANSRTGHVQIKPDNSQHVSLMFKYRSPRTFRRKRRFIKTIWKLIRSDPNDLTFR